MRPCTWPDGLLMSVGEWVEEYYPGYEPDLSLRPDAVAIARRIAEEHAEFDISPDFVRYGRYGGNPVSNLVAAKFAHDVGADKLGYKARLTGSGLNAIWVAMLSATEGRNPNNVSIVRSEPLYGLTPGVLRFFGSTVSVSGSHTDDLVSTSKRLMEDAGACVLWLETIGNGVPMSVVRLRQIFSELWNERMVIIVDNTFATCHLYNPFGILQNIIRERGGRPSFTFVYVESLSKYYRCRTALAPGDQATAGIVVGPSDLIAHCDQWIQTGHALQWPALQGFPVGLYQASGIVTNLSWTTRDVARWLRLQDREVEEVWYPDDDLLLSGAGGVMYLRLCTDDPQLPDRIFDDVIEPRGSFGHDHASYINFGLHGAEPGTVRLAVGTRDTLGSLTTLLRRALDRM